MTKWIFNEKARLRFDDYVVHGYRLYDTAWYSDDGMSDCPSLNPENEWMLEILSWYKVGKDKFAGANSPIKMKMWFKSKDDANKCWKAIKDCNPCFDILEAMGFVKVV